MKNLSQRRTSRIAREGCAFNVRGRCRPRPLLPGQSPVTETHRFRYPRPTTARIAVLGVKFKSPSCTWLAHGRGHRRQPDRAPSEDRRPDILQVDVGDNGSADFSFKRRHIARIAVNSQAGDDLVRIDESNGIFTDSIPTRLDGGAGNDTLSGGSGAEMLLGGDGNDTIDGNMGNDLALLGAGDDTFVWDPGDASDIVEGQAGNDQMVFNGADANEKFDLSANGSRLSSSATSAT